MTGDMASAGLAQAVANPGISVSINVEKSDNGVIITGFFETVTTEGKFSRSKRIAAVTAKDVTSDQAKRKVQRTLVNWVKAYFPAPPRADKKEKADKS